MTRLLIAASGTGGHIFPALSVAEALPESWEIFWLGVHERLESKVIPIDYELTFIPAGGLQAKGIKKCFQLIKLLLTTIFVIRLIKRKGIEIVFTTGGYIAVPAIIGARLCGINIILHESNALPGKATRLLGKFCNKVALGLPIAAGKLKGCNISVTGTPVRKPFLSFNPLPHWVPTVKIGPLIVVVGGSQGALGLNFMIRENLSWLLDQGCRVVHITGNIDQSRRYEHENLVQIPFVDDLSGLLQHADLVISRAGAGALSEFAICNTPAVFVPYPYAADNHQEYNAAYAAQYGAALIVHENRTTGKPLRRVLETLLNNHFCTDEENNNLLCKMREGMREIAVRDAHLQLVDILMSYC